MTVNSEQSAGGRRQLRHNHSARSSRRGHQLAVGRRQPMAEVEQSAPSGPRLARCSLLTGHLNYRHFWDWYHKLTAPFTDVGILLDHLTLQIPRQNEHVIGFGFANLVRLMDRDVSAGQEFALLMRASINHIIEEIRTDPAVVQKSVSLSRRSISDGRATLLLCLD